MKEWLKSVLNYRSYPQIKLVSVFWTTVYVKRKPVMAFFRFKKHQMR